MLQDQETQELKIGGGVKEVMEKYMKKMWGTSEELKPISMEGIPANKKMKVREDINRIIVEKEIARAIRKLKKNKSPGEDLIPNEVWMVLEGEGMKELQGILEECRRTNSFP